MEALLFFLQRSIYWSLGAGCIVNFFVIGNYYILLEKITLPKELHFLNELKNVDVSVSIAILIVATVIIGIFLEGINEIFIQCFFDNTKKMVKNEYKNNSREIWKSPGSIAKKLNLKGSIIFFLFRKASYVEVCAKIEKTETKNYSVGIPSESTYEFMSDHNCSNVVNGLNFWAKVISNTEKSNEIYIYRDLSFMMELIRTSFLLIFLFSFLALVLVSILYRLHFLFWWYLASIVLSAVFFIVTNTITEYFGKRYIRNVGLAYKALKLMKEKISSN